MFHVWSKPHHVGTNHSTTIGPICFLIGCPHCYEIGLAPSVVFSRFGLVVVAVYVVLEKAMDEGECWRSSIRRPGAT